MHLSSPNDNFSKTKLSRKAHFTRVTEVVELVQKCWNPMDMQQVCNKYINDMYRTFFSKRLLESVLFPCAISY